MIRPSPRRMTPLTPTAQHRLVRASREAEIARCEREIAAAQAELRAGNKDIEGLCLCIADWAGEKRLIENEGANASLLQRDRSPESRLAAGVDFVRGDSSGRRG